MSSQESSRRTFLKNASLIAGAAWAGASWTRPAAAKPASGLFIASNSYSWAVYYQREGRDFNSALDAGFADVAKSTVNGYEAGIGSPGEVERLAALLAKHGLAMRSIYVGSVLHDAAQADKNVAQILAIAEKAKAAGTRILVTNPNPLRWGGPENKSDAQLKTQAAALEELGRQLGKIGMVLAYHNHDIELRNAAREFHHMMAGTDPKCVTLCLDAHWVYRGAGNSSVALFDVVKLYGSRITELHLRQSKDGIWSETFGEGDIDYPLLAERLKDLGIKPHLVMEIAVEKGTPKTLDPVEAHRQSCAYARKVFAGFET